jgi:hypothetical protein
MQSRSETRHKLNKHGEEMKLKAGRRYLTRDNEVITIQKSSYVTTCRGYPFTGFTKDGNKRTYTEAGMFYRDGWPDNWDLVELLPEPAAFAEVLAE